MVREGMGSGPMRYSQRLEMLKTASAMGLGRFEANLILAIEQNRANPLDCAQPTRNWSGIVTCLTVALVQSLICAGIWWIVRG